MVPSISAEITEGKTLVNQVTHDNSLGIYFFLHDHKITFVSIIFYGLFTFLQFQKSSSFNTGTHNSLALNVFCSFAM